MIPFEKMHLCQGYEPIDIINTLGRGSRGSTISLLGGVIPFVISFQRRTHRPVSVKSPNVASTPPRPPLGDGRGVGRLLERLVADRHFLEPRLLAPFLLFRAHTYQRPPIAGVCVGH